MPVGEGRTRLGIPRGDWQSQLVASVPRLARNARHGVPAESLSHESLHKVVVGSLRMPESFCWESGAEERSAFAQGEQFGHEEHKKDDGVLVLFVPKFGGGVYAVFFCAMLA